MTNSVSPLLRGFVAWVFFVAAMAKIARPESVRWLAEALPGLNRSDATLVAYASAALELVAGAALFFRRTSLVAIGMAAVFLTGGIVTTGVMLFRGMPVSCGCFGALTPLTWLERPVPAVFRNLGLLAALAVSAMPLLRRRSADSFRPVPEVPARARGFTLVELLVVIGVVALLLAVLLPALNRVRESGRATQCAARLRDHGLAFVQYAQDSRGYVPRTYNAYWSDRRPAWPLVAGRYLVPDEPWDRTMWDETFGEKLVGELDVFRCPSHPLGGVVGSFLINAFAFETRPNWRPTGPVKLSAVRNAPGVVWIAEATDLYGTNDFLTSGDYDDIYAVDTHAVWLPKHLPGGAAPRVSESRHRGRGNVLWFDASVRAVRPGELRAEMFDDGVTARPAPQGPPATYP